MALISPKNVEKIYGANTAELSQWRQAGIRPQFYRISARVVRYGTDDLDKWFHDPASEHLHDFPIRASPNLCLV
ncbi:hypothetical protein IWX64_002654 [Arthrobacter sp. CAN_A212]|uniref:hypothetical protein n=1 Tax=Arthrobacter sp. CAN_A212 TaxID=2787719 RepID=UPI0018CA887D